MTIDPDLRARIMEALSPDNLSAEDAARLWCSMKGVEFLKIHRSVGAYDAVVTFQRHGKRPSRLLASYISRDFGSYDFLIAEAERRGLVWRIDSLGIARLGPSSKHTVGHPHSTLLALALALADAGEKETD